MKWYFLLFILSILCLFIAVFRFYESAEFVVFREAVILEIYWEKKPSLMYYQKAFYLHIQRLSKKPPLYPTANVFSPSILIQAKVNERKYIIEMMKKLFLMLYSKEQR